MSLKQSWIEENSVLFSLPVFAPVNFCSIMTVLPLESGICCSKHPLMIRHVYELFSASFDITSLGHSIRSFALWPNMNKFTTTVLGGRTPSSDHSAWGQCGQPQLFKKRVELSRILKLCLVLIPRFLPTKSVGWTLHKLIPDFQIPSGNIQKMVQIHDSHNGGQGGKTVGNDYSKEE